MSINKEDSPHSDVVKTKYQVGRQGRVVIMRLDDREDIRNSILEVANNENIRSAVVYVLGGVKKGRVVVGPKTAEPPIVPIWCEVDEPHEMLAIGTIFQQDNKPNLHIHGTFGRGDSVKAGCLREVSETFLIAEVIIMEIEGINARREVDSATGFSLLRV